MTEWLAAISSAVAGGTVVAVFWLWYELRQLKKLNRDLKKIQDAQAASQAEDQRSRKPVRSMWGDMERSKKPPAGADRRSTGSEGT